MIYIFSHSAPHTTARYFERAAGLESRTQVSYRVAAPAVAELSADDLLVYIDPAEDWPIGLERSPCVNVAFLIDVHQDLSSRLECAPFFDLVFVAQKDYVSAFTAAGHPAAFWLPFGCDPGIHTVPSRQRDIDVAFVGKPGKRGTLRHAVLEAVVSEFHTNGHERFYDPPEMGALYGRSKIVLNVGINGDLNMRFFEALASGALLVTNRIGNGVDELFEEDRHYVGYSTVAEALAKIRYYLSAHVPRGRIARAGQRKVLAEHTYQLRWREVLHRLDGVRGKAPARGYSKRALSALYSHIYVSLRRPARIGAVIGAYGPSTGRPTRYPDGIRAMAERSHSSDPERPALALSGSHIRQADMVSRPGRYARNLGAMVGQAAVQRIMGMLTTMVLARVLGVTRFGTYSVVASTASSAYGVIRLGLDAAIHVHTAEQSNDADAKANGTLGQMLGAGLLLLIVAATVGLGGCLVFANTIAETVYGDRALAPWIRLAGLSVLLQCVSQFCYATLAGLQRFTAYSKVMAVTALLQAVSITLGGLLGGLRGAVAASLCLQAVTVTLMARLVRDELHTETVRLAFDDAASWAAKLLTFGLPFHLAGLVSVPVTYYLQGALAKHAGLDALGYLRVVLSVTTIVSFVPASAATAMISMLTNVRMTRGGAFAADTMRSLKIVSLFSLLVAIIVNLALPWLMPGLFGQAYGQVTTAASIALVSSVLAATAGVIGNALFSARRLDLVFLSTVLQMLTFLLFGSLLIATHGLIGYLLADLFGYVALLIVTYGCSLRWLRQNVVATRWLPRILVPLLLLLTYAAVHIARGGTRSWSAVVIGTCAFIAVCVWGHNALLDEDERDAVYRFIQSPRWSFQK